MKTQGKSSLALILILVELDSTENKFMPKNGSAELFAKATISLISLVEAQRTK
jgi:hypothetical protein